MTVPIGMPPLPHPEGASQKSSQEAVSQTPFHNRDHQGWPGLPDGHIREGASGDWAYIGIFPQGPLCAATVRKGGTTAKQGPQGWVQGAGLTGERPLPARSSASPYWTGRAQPGLCR